MMWKIEWEKKALKDVKKLDKTARKRIVSYLEERVLAEQNPYQIGKPLQGTKLGLWRYRVGNYRIICQIKDKELIVLVVAVGHRKDIYL
ncbi:MAG: type II toxin-antitoxin system mRNA interferase toxin, RelE/StbE family [Cyanobacteria bacterium]|nr:type II toxin-antitoxin system mRNA interferase toxin, RelE/StbE family [Cyanobacteria bacterium GSL.Bin21]